VKPTSICWTSRLNGLVLFLLSMLLLASALALPKADASTEDAGRKGPTTASEEEPSGEFAGESTGRADEKKPAGSPSTGAQAGPSTAGRNARLVASLTVFVLSIFVGFEVITKVPPTLHTPLMSGSNAISGITIVGALLAAGHAVGGFGAFLGLLAVLLAAINVFGGFLVTHRMLMMFKKR
jgi:H+-translocating NAD(P) transhydrogenase subunit alpha